MARNAALAQHFLPLREKLGVVVVLLYACKILDPHPHSSFS